MVSLLRRLSDRVDWVARALLVPIGIAFILIVFSGVVTRYVFQMPIITSVELARIGFVWAAFLGAAVCLKEEKHTQFLFLMDKASGRLKSVMKLAIDLISAALFAFLLVKGVQMVQAVQETFFPALGWSQLWLYLPLPLCSLFMLVHVISSLARDLHELAQGVSERRVA